MKSSKNPSKNLPPLPPEVVESITPETRCTCTVSNNWTPPPGSGLQPGQTTCTVTLDGRTYSATEEQIHEIHVRKGFLAEGKAFLAKNLPAMFGKAQA